MRVLGVDHGARTGYAVLDDGKLLACGYKTITYGTDVVDGSRFGYAQGKKLDNLYNFVDLLISTYKPDFVSFEQPKDRTNGNTSQTLISYYAIAMYAAFKNNMNVCESHPMTVKKVVTGKGNAEKQDVAKWIAIHLNVPIERIRPVEYYKVGAKKGQIKKYYYDESDACALAYYAWQLHRKDV